MKREVPHLFVIVVALTMAMVCATANAKKPDNPGGGNGGGGGGGGGGNEMIVARLEPADGAGLHDHAYDINDLREVVGRVSLPNGDLSAALWTVSETDAVVQSTLTLLDGGHSALAINNLGEIVGQTNDPSGTAVGVYWASAASSAIALPLLPGFNASYPYSVNDDGLICGLVAVSGVQFSSRPVLWQASSSGGVPIVSQPIELPVVADAAASGLTNNDASGFATVVGFQRSTQTPLQWVVQTLPDGTISVPSGPTVLDLNDQGLATGINNDGLVCGRTDVDAVVWSGGSPSLLDRPGKGKRKVSRTWAWDIGDSGIIVGEAGPQIDSRACFWDGIDGSLTYLDDYLDSDSPLQGLDSAEAVNVFGDIVGVGWYGAFIAVPESP